MDAQQRNELIRKGNAAFNEGNIHLASKIFKATKYKDGLIRVGDHYFYELEQPLMAYGYYRAAGHSAMLDKIFESFTFALQCWISDEPGEEKEASQGDIKPASSESINKLVAMIDSKNAEVGRDYIG